MGIGDPSNILLKSFLSFGAQVTVPIENSKVFDDVVFGIAKRFTVPSSGVANIVFDGTAVTTTNLILLPIALKAFGAGPIEVDLYFGGTYGDDGTNWDCFNRDNTSSTECSTVVRLNPTITEIGTQLPTEFVIYSDGIPAIATIGGDVRNDFITNLMKSGKYLIRLTNTEANQASAWIGLNWFEDNNPV